MTTESKQENLRFGERAVHEGFISADQLDEMLKLQERYRGSGKKVPKIGELLAYKQLITKEQVIKLLRGRRASQPTRPAGDPEGNGDGEGGGDDVDADDDSEAPLPLPDERNLDMTGAVSALAMTGAVAKLKVSRPELKVDDEYSEYSIELKVDSDYIGDLYLAREKGERTRTLMLRIFDPKRTKNVVFKQGLVFSSKALAKIDNPVVQQVLKLGKSRNCYFMAAEYFRGETLSEKLRSRKPLDYPVALKLLRQLAEGLHVLHNKNCYHFDIRPDNIAIDGEGDAHLLGVGIPLDLPALLRHLRRGKTPEPLYLAPEMLDGSGDVDVRSDIFELGATLYHAFTGTAPFRANNAEDLLRQICAKGVPSIRKSNQTVPAEAAEVVARMMHSDPDKRFQSASELMGALRRLPEEGISSVAKIDYGAVLGEAATAPPQTASKPNSPSASSSMPDSVPSIALDESGAVRKDIDYSSLVAQMTQQAAKEEREEATQKKDRAARGKFSAPAGRSYQKVDSAGPIAVPGWLKKTLVGLAIGGLIFATVFVTVGIQQQKRINEKTRTENDKRGPASNPKAPPGGEASQRQTEQAQQQKLLDGQLTQAMMLLEADTQYQAGLDQVIWNAKNLLTSSGGNWALQGDVLNIIGRAYYYKIFLDEFSQIPASIRKDWRDSAVKAFKDAVKSYDADNAETRFKLRLKRWMPESRNPKKHDVSRGVVDYRGKLATARRDMELLMRIVRSLN